MDFSIRNSGLTDVLNHVKTKHHQDCDTAVGSTKTVRSYFTSQVPENVLEAEIRWATFVAKHNLPFLASDHATKLFAIMFPDSAIAKKFSCARTKTTAIVKLGLAHYFIDKKIHAISTPFSLLMDESNDRVDKSCIILVRLLDEELGEVRTRFLDMPVVNIGNASNLLEAVKASLNKHGLSFDSMVSFMSDTTNVMKGARSGVQSLIKRENPSVYDVGCICHLADLTLKAGMKELLLNVDQLFVDIFYFFVHSSKRKQLFEDLWCSLFTTEPEVILKHSPTRWLSLLRCVDRYLAQLDGLVSYFLSCEEAETAKVRNILKVLQNPMTKPTLHFLSFILPAMDRFSKLFQKSTENTTSHLYTEISRLVRLYASNFLSVSAVRAVGDNLQNLDFSEANFVPRDELGIGTNTWLNIAQIEEQHDISPFLESIKNFYIASTKKMLKKFPFGDSLMKDLAILQPDATATFSPNTVISLATRFPQLGISNLDALREEFRDFQLSQTDLPLIVQYKAGDSALRARAGLFWSEISKMLTLDGSQRFPFLSKLIIGLLTIPASNADSERGFSILRKIHTDQRANLDQSTINALMSVKYNCDQCCTDIQVSPQLMSLCKKATTAYVTPRAKAGECSSSTSTE